MNPALSSVLLLAGAAATAANALWRSRWWDQRLTEAREHLDAGRFAEAITPLERHPPVWSVLVMVAAGVTMGVGIVGVLS
ncbi:hypothetical protein ACIRLA_46590 [Streptomyces sp. NPDC102364]|uniref:hypothetical protein n=1 Tax=Streptomyces sp. NPDC102364 TaxID=3366161 RepID=UPI0038186371